MRFFRNLLIGVVVLIVLAVGVAYLLPRHVVVEREVVIDAPPEVVFDHVNSLQAFSEWSPWGDYDPDMQVMYSGPETGVGNTMEWTSDHRNVGNGRQEITEVIENQAVRTSLAFDGMGEAEAWWASGARGRRNTRDLGPRVRHGQQPHRPMDGADARRVRRRGLRARTGAVAHGGGELSPQGAQFSIISSGHVISTAISMRAVSPGATSRSQAATPRRSSTSISSGARE
jgi:hypothetical protein